MIFLFSPIILLVTMQKTGSSYLFIRDFYFTKTVLRLYSNISKVCIGINKMASIYCVNMNYFYNFFTSIIY